MGEFLLFAVLGTLASRLLGAELSWPRRLFAAFLGVSAGSIIAWLLAGWRPPANPATVDVAGPVQLAWSLMTTMAAVGLFELAGRPGQFTGVLAAKSSVTGVANKQARSRRNGRAGTVWAAP
ncbi:MAG TPA: hypothetical protein VFD47_01940 [Actinomycetota bacterium]|nr:hypothetical protein [Actinomycetota bacterium]